GRAESPRERCSSQTRRLRRGQLPGPHALAARRRSPQARGVTGMPAAQHAFMPRSSTVINVLDLLTSQHSEVDQLMSQLESGRGDRVEVFRQLADKLAAHATVEERIFYPAVMQDETSDLLH